MTERTGGPPLERRQSIERPGELSLPGCLGPRIFQGRFILRLLRFLPATGRDGSLSTASVNRRGSPSMPRAELGIMLRKAGAAIGSTDSRLSFANPSGLPFPQDLHDPQIDQSTDPQRCAASGGHASSSSPSISRPQRSGIGFVLHKQDQIYRH